MFNKVILLGNLTRDLELRYGNNGSAVASTAIATSRKFTQNGEKKEEVCFIDLTFFGRSAEIANQYLRRGSKIHVDGRIKFDQWVAQDGSKRSKHTVIVENMQMLDNKNDNVDNNAIPQQQSQYKNDDYSAEAQRERAQQTQNQTYKAPAPVHETIPKNNIPTIDIDEDEVPF